MTPLMASHKEAGAMGWLGRDGLNLCEGAGEGTVAPAKQDGEAIIIIILLLFHQGPPPPSAAHYKYCMIVGCAALDTSGSGPPGGSADGLAVLAGAAVPSPAPSHRLSPSLPNPPIAPASLCDTISGVMPGPSGQG